MPVAIYIGRDPVEPKKPRMFSHYHENYPGAVRIIEDIWLAFNASPDPCVVIVNPFAAFQEYDYPLADPVRDRSFSADIVVLTSTGVGIVEMKHNQGEIICEDDGNWYALDESGQSSNVMAGAEEKDRLGKPRYLNPHIQVQKYAKELRKQLGGKGAAYSLPIPTHQLRNVKYQTCTCFTNRQVTISEVVAKYKPNKRLWWEQFEIIKAEHIVPWVRSLSLGITESEPPYGNYKLSGQKDLKPIAERVLKALEWGEAYEWMPTDEPYGGLALIKDGKLQHQFRLRRREESIGRSGNIYIPQEYSIVGNAHARIFRDLDKVVIHNLHRHRTYVNQREVGEGGHPLKDKDRITLGGPVATDKVCLLVFEGNAPTPIGTETVSITEEGSSDKTA